MRIGPNGFVRGLVSTSPRLYQEIVRLAGERLTLAGINLSAADVRRVAVETPGIRLTGEQDYLTLFIWSVNSVGQTVVVELAPEIQGAVRTRNRCLARLVTTEQLRTAEMTIGSGFFQMTLRLPPNTCLVEVLGGGGKRRHFLLEEEVPRA